MHVSLHLSVYPASIYIYIYIYIYNTPAALSSLRCTSSTKRRNHRQTERLAPQASPTCTENRTRIIINPIIMRMIH